MTIFTLWLHLLQSLMPCKTRKAITDVVLASLDRWQESHSWELPWTWMVLSSSRWCPGVGEWLHLKRKNSDLGVIDELQGEVTESVIIADGFLSCPPWGLMEPFSFIVDKCLYMRLSSVFRSRFNKNVYQEVSWSESQSGWAFLHKQ